ncbi:MAG: CTP synthase [Phycisphaeraceae bacterium]
MPIQPPTPDDEPQLSTEEMLAAAGSAHSESEFFNPMPLGYRPGHHKYVIVLGTVMSGLGKGIFSSSLAKLLKDKGLSVAPIKMEGYLNIDSGTLNPYRHGEVFVLDDGTETDMDLGTYERMLDQDLTRDNFVTSGQIYRRVLDKERHGGYLGRDVQMIPHVTGEVKYLLRSLAVKQNADVVFVEVGGTVGDFENGFYIEALRELAFEEGPGSTCFVSLTYVIEPQALGEQKSKAAQLGLKKVMEAGIQPHIVACRAKNPVRDSVREKIAMFSNVPIHRVFSMHDRESIYTVPDAMHDAAIDREVLSILDLHERTNPVAEDRSRARWHWFMNKLSAPRKHKVTVGITGKYAALRDAYASIDKALEHCATHLSAELDVKWIDTTEMTPGRESDDAARQLAGLNAVIVPGGFGVRGTDGKLACVQYCRENKLPYLGICLGFQMAVIEFARHVCGLDGADSTEFDAKAKHPVIDILPEQKKIEGLGGNMRLGGKDVLVSASTLAAFLYAEQATKAQGIGDKGQGTGSRGIIRNPRSAIRIPSEPSLSHNPARIDVPSQAFMIRQRFRHRYEVHPDYIERLEQGGLIFSGRHPQQPIMQILELPRTGPQAHPYFVGGQFHPELVGRPLRPQPMFLGLLAAAIRHANPELAPELISARWLPFAEKEKATVGA